MEEIGRKHGMTVETCAERMDLGSVGEVKSLKERQLRLFDDSWNL